MKLEVGSGPLVVAIAGPNGAGKSTFFARFIQPLGLPFVNADVLAEANKIGAYEAAELAHELRCDLIARGESFVFETVLSAPAGAKVDFLRRTAEAGYNVVLCFIGLSSPEESDGRVALRVTKGGHDVPTDKLMARYPRTLGNLRRALRVLPSVLVYDNSDLVQPFRFVVEYRAGVQVRRGGVLPEWLSPLLEQANT